MVERFAAQPLRFAPGTDWHYGSPGYAILASAVERIADVPYAEFVRVNLLEPLGMRSTRIGGGWHPDDAVGYSGPAVAPSFGLDTVCRGAGDVWSSVLDLLIWDRALASGSLLTSASRAAMFSCHARVRGAYDLEAGTCYGYAWFLGSLHGRRARYHMGDNPGFVSMNTWLSDEDMIVIVLSNDDETDAIRVALRTIDAELNLPFVNLGS
jgi:CubicO group peptidase (beta-lactamase class C family)